MRTRQSLHSFRLCALLALVACAAQNLLAQTTISTFQGRLEIDSVPANGQFDFQFKLFDAATGGAQQGAMLEQLNIFVSNGDYTVNLDFGAAVFPGADRFIEVSFRPAGNGTYTTLPTRQQIISAPYSIRSLVSTTADGLSVSCSSCVTSSQIQSVQGSQVAGSIAGSQISGAIPVPSVPPGSPNYIQNTTSQQAASNFNISGNGTVGGTLSAASVNAATQYNIAGVRVLGTAGSLNLFAGVDAGGSNTSVKNSFFGASAGQNNTSGGSNSFFGAQAGQSNTTGASNAFFGSAAGQSNTSGSVNSLFGQFAGQNNTTGANNSFFGNASGSANTTGGRNSFFGSGAGKSNSTGGFNSSFGFAAGASNATGDFNSFFGNSAGLNNKAGMGNTFIGDGADFNSANPTGDNNTLLGRLANVNSGVSNATAIGASAQAIASHTVVLGTDQEIVIVPGKLEVDTLGVAGNQQVCLNKQNRLAPCSSSLRYKTDLRPFTGGISIINQLQPVTFTWKDGGMRDLGFGAEDVAKIEPLFVTYNAQSQVEGVKYDRITVALVNAIKEQQGQIRWQQSRFEQQQEQLKLQQTQLEQQHHQIESLKKLTCLEHPNADICK